MKTGTKYEIEHDLNFYYYGQGGLLDIVSEKNFIWVTGSIKKNGKYTTAVYSAELIENKLINEKSVFAPNPTACDVISASIFVLHT